MNIPKLSVILPVYNDESNIKQAIQSILNQSFIDFELIIINDGSTDSSPKIINSFSDHRIRMINQSNMGIVPSLNKGIINSQGEYIARMDSDDISDPTRFSKQLEFLENNSDYGVVGSACLIVDDNGNMIKHFNVPIYDKDVRNALIWRNPLVHSSIVMRKSDLIKVGLYSNYFSGAEDYELWFRMINVCKIANIDQELVTRKHRSKSSFRVKKSTHYKLKSKILLVSIAYGEKRMKKIISLGASLLKYSCHRVIESFTE